MRIGHRLRGLFLAGAFVLVAGALTGALAAPRDGTAPSLAEQVLYKFCSQSACADGYHPYAGVIMDGAGNLYGTTLTNGAPGQGTVFQLTKTSAGWSEKVLYSFCSQGACADGNYPFAGLIMDGAGNLYGTTGYGGANNSGVVFELTPSGAGWSEKVLYSFCSQSNCADGSYPSAGLILDGAGNLYGTTPYGGANTSCPGSSRGVADCGVVFELTPSGTGWSEKVLYSFCSQSNCADGNAPSAGLIMDGAGNLYGTAAAGGKIISPCPSSDGCGVVFELTPRGTGWTETVLYSFCSQSNCADGAGPGLILDGGGNLYGTTYGGGKIINPCPSSHGCGVVFELTPTTNGWTETVLYSFCSQSNCADGQNPTAGVIMDGSGNLYGTTIYGGKNWGVVFELTLPSNNTLSVFVVGSPGGRVTSSPSGINCGSTCSASFAAGTQVTLTASPATAWGFFGWGGACSGIGGCAVTMSANTSVSATFSTLFSGEAAPVATSNPDVPALLPAVISPIPQSQ